jgi:hydrogenase expression/formation protein HypC
MCLAVPGQLIETFDCDGIRSGKVNFGGVLKQVCLEYTPQARPGDYVLVHVGFALGIIDAEEAARTYKLLEELGQLDELNDVPQT